MMCWLGPTAVTRLMYLVATAAAAINIFRFGKSLISMWTLLGNPVPRQQPLAYSPHLWPVTQSVSLPYSATTDALVRSSPNSIRRSRRVFAPISWEQISLLLWRTAHCQRTAESSLGFRLQQRAVPSAGAIHPIHLLVQMPDDAGAWARYNPLTHSLDVIGTCARVLNPLRQQADEIVLAQPGILLIFVAEPQMTAAKYENPDSLIWRDAGVLQGALAMTSEDLGLNFCLLGITGDPWVGQLSKQCQLAGVGLAALGARP